MPFKPPRKLPQFADLKGILAQTRSIDSALYQVVEQIIDRLQQYPITTTLIQEGGGGGGTGPGAGFATPFATFLTKEDETAALQNSIQVLARYGITFDDSTANKRYVDLNLEYLGTFAAGPLYSDGDIVVADDGIAYMCVKPTNSPPEMWPGVGLATAVGPPGPPGPAGDAALDATYWTVAPHPSLSNERALNLLANGYVKSTAGIPSTIAVIPVSEGGTSGTNPTDARTNLGCGTMATQNHFDVNITGGQASLRFFELRHNAEPAIAIVNTGSNTFWYIKSGPSTNLDIFNYNVDGSNGIASAWITRAGVMTAIGFSGNGAALTNLHGPNIATGLVGTARLGAGTANSGTYLRGDQQWAPISSPESIPSGLIAMFTTACPAGWTRVTALDGRFPMGSNGFGDSGGGGSHFHTFGVNTTNAGGHSHGVTGSGSGSATGAVGGTTQGASVGPQTADAGGSFTTIGPHNHVFNVEANLGVSVSVSGLTGVDGDHNHQVNGSTSSIASNAADMLPPYLTMVFCQKN